MKKLKVKIIENNNEIEIKFFNGKNQIGSDKKYINECIVCKTKTINDKYFGEKHICSECLEIIKQATNFEEKPKEQNTKYKKDTSIYAATKDFYSTIKIVDFIEYANVMNKKIGEKTATAIVNLILEGYNTATKIGTMFGSDNIATIYNYLITMAKAGMLCATKRTKNLHNRIFKLNPALTYTRV